MLMLGPLHRPPCCGLSAIQASAQLGGAACAPQHGHKVLHWRSSRAAVCLPLQTLMRLLKESPFQVRKEAAFALANICADGGGGTGGWVGGWAVDGWIGGCVCKYMRAGSGRESEQPSSRPASYPYPSPARLMGAPAPAP